VDVNGTDWGRSQSTNVLSFQSDSAVSGNGNCSKYVSIDGFAGNGLKDNVYAKQGSITNNNRISVLSVDRWIHIEERVDNQSNHYLAEINESLPTIITSKDDFYYKGAGIYSRGVYSSKDRKVSLDYRATTLSKSISFGGYFSNAIIRADIKPSQVQVLDLTNSSMAFGVSSMSDIYSEIAFSSDNLKLDQTYLGLYKINSKFISNSKFNLDEWDGQELPCCQP
jgi:hypothetical protein